MKLYSYQGQEPQLLPERIRLENGYTITNLNQLSDDELKSYGFSGPFEIPQIDITKQEVLWNGSEYVITNILQELLQEREQIQLQKAIEGIDINHFWNLFKSTSFHRRLRKESGNDLKTNILYTEFVSNLNLESFLRNLDKFFLTISFEEQEINELQSFLNEFNLTYKIPDSTQKYYDFDSDKIIDNSTKPFSSWIWNGEKWTAPVPYPTDGKYYIWNEKTTTWKKLPTKK